MDQRIIDLYDAYTHAPLPRRVFLERLAALTGSAAAASALLPLLDNNYAKAAIVAPDDARIETATITYPGKAGAVKAYLARPRGAEKRPGVVAVHENRGLQPHNQDVARRLAVAGFVALAPDLLSALGGTRADEDRAREIHGQLKGEDALADLRAAVASLKARPDATGRIGAVGFCWGGSMIKLLAASEPDLAAAVPFYGAAPAPEVARNTKAKVLAHYAENDDRVNSTAAPYAAALREANVPLTAYTYPGTQHSFHNDTAGVRYHKAAAELAWSRTIAFFKETLG